MQSFSFPVFHSGLNLVQNFCEERYREIEGGTGGEKEEAGEGVDGPFVRAGAGRGGRTLDAERGRLRRLLVLPHASNCCCRCGVRGPYGGAPR